MDFLKPTQQPHCSRLLAILQTSLFACDFSVMGAGKTWIGNVIAVEAGMPILVLGPRSALTNWESVNRHLGGQFLAGLTYESLRSIRGHQPKHGYLHRYDYDDGSSGFVVTPHFQSLVDSGLILICDEFQKIKNNSGQTEAVRALSRDIINRGGRSRVIFMSGSPFDESRHAANFFRTVGFISNPKMYMTTKKGDFVPLGLGELVDHLELIHPDETHHLMMESLPLNKRKVDPFILKAFISIIVPYFTSAMPSPPIDFQKDVANGYYRLETPVQVNRLTEAITMLRKAAAFNPATNTVAYNSSTLGAITQALQEVEIAKLPMFERLIRQDLESTPKGKVIVFLNYRHTIDALAESLHEYAPLIFDGRVTSQAQEDRVIDSFQNQGSRLLLANLKKGGIAINLQDLHGDEPRTSYISPTFSILSMHQASGRTYRPGQASDATIRVVYGYIEADESRVMESRILAALSRKTDNLKKILTVQASEGVLFPGEYPDLIEDPV